MSSFYDRDVFERAHHLVKIDGRLILGEKSVACKLPR